MGTACFHSMGSETSAGKLRGWERLTGWGPLEASSLTCLVFSQETQRLALLTTAHSWPFHGAWLPHSMVASGWSRFSQGHMRLPVECSSEQGNVTSYFMSSWDEMQHHFCHILSDKVVTSLPIFKGMGIGLSLLMGEGWGPRAHGRTVGQCIWWGGGSAFRNFNLPPAIFTSHPERCHSTPPTELSPGFRHRVRCHLDHIYGR